MSTSEMASSEVQRPLGGIRVVELATGHGASGGAAILAELGAEVIKIEPPEGDPARSQATPLAVRAEAPPGWTLLHEMSNRGKRSICIDLHSAAGKQVLNRLASTADVFVTSSGPRERAELGLDYGSLSAANPKLILAKITAFGERGELKDAKGSDEMAQGLCGLPALAAGDEPLFFPNHFLEQLGAMTLSHAIMSALIARDASGRGQEIETSLVAAGVWVQFVNIFLTSMLKVEPAIKWDRSVQPPLRNARPCKDGKWLLLCVHIESKYWGDFSKLLGLTHLVDDPRFSSQEARYKNARELNKLVDEAMMTRTSAEWEGPLRDAGLLFAPANTYSELFEDSVALENDYILQWEHPVMGRLRVPGYPAHFSDAGLCLRRAAPKCGEHTEEVMAWAGYDKGEVRALRGAGAIYTAVDLDCPSAVRHRKTVSDSSLET